MAKLWRYNPETPEGKYPIVLRRDGTPLESRFIVMTLKDPATPAALTAYADAAETLGFDPEYVSSIRQLADECFKERVTSFHPGDPDAPPHRKDDPVIMAWARSIGCPGS
jgi:hypothetical protein